MIAFIQYYLAPQSLNYLTIYFEYSLTSAITARWFLSLRRTVKEGNSNPNTLISPTNAQRVSKRTSAIERGAMSFGLRSNGGKEVTTPQKSITGIRIERETYMMSDMAEEGAVKSVPIWYDS